MSEKLPQTYANHTRVDPLYFYVVFPIFAVNVLVSLYHLVRMPGFFSLWHVFSTLAMLVVLFRIRTYPIKVQDRVIRLEERLRLTALLPDPLRSRVPELREGQLVALRFASDAELPALVQQTLDEKLPGSEIKKRIVSWRPDTWRV